MKKYCALFILLASLGCGAGDAQNAAEKTVATYFAALNAKDWSKAQACFSVPFFTAVTPETHVKMLENLVTKLGKYESHSLAGMQYKTGTSTFTTLVFNVKYAKGSAKETFVFHGSPNAEGYFISSHNIASAALLMPDK